MYKLINGDMLDELDKMQEKSIDCIITDPPYELNFMNKGWDNAGISFQKGTWEKCLRVLKPGGYLLAFGGSRTFHRIAVAIEDAGFEIRDTIMWIYGSGFPKSMSLGKVIEGKQVLGSANVKDIKKLKGKKEIVSGGWNSNEVEQGKRKTEYEQVKTEVEYTTDLAKQWQGWGTALKPSFEPIIVARKPFKGSLVDNVIKYGVGGINIDECRVETTDVYSYPNGGGGSSFGIGKGVDGTRTKPTESNSLGRFPANTILTYDQITFDEVCGGFPYTKDNGGKPNYEKSNYTSYCDILGGNAYKRGIHYKESGSASRYFYCAKASKKDRDEGLEHFEKSKVNDGRKKDIDNAFQRGETLRKNTHPTVKPTTLMQYLVRLVSPKGATILDPFMGSGSTGKAIMYENKERNANYKFIGIEQNEEYCKIAKARIENINTEV